MNTKDQESKQENQHGHQNQPPKKGQNPNDRQNRQAEHLLAFYLDKHVISVQTGWRLSNSAALIRSSDLSQAI